MKDKIKQHRMLAVQRLNNGEIPGSICASVGKDYMVSEDETKPARLAFEQRKNSKSGFSKLWRNTLLKAFATSHERMPEYMVATIEAKEKNLKLIMGKKTGTEIWL